MLKFFHVGFHTSPQPLPKFFPVNKKRIFGNIGALTTKTKTKTKTKTSYVFYYLLLLLCLTIMWSTV